MKKYLVYAIRDFGAKNKLEKSIMDLLTLNNRMLVEQKDLETFKKNIIAQINFLNQENKRCAPKNVSWCKKGTKHKDFSLSGIACISFNLYEIKKTYEIES
ncbi:hypothetical protein EG346_15795 [Chryseobacterium carnipullorum]|uniref:Uncharacterized protein n=1 Tax=Chryseobacterium carnipullorum TaxID=1124835 RepID=A0A376DSJ5_CHRCU|nr:hypothetical protein [Chryseobacterium carnipullorum]AZA49549.1 hypothetical protein EG346_15795 [Chryseobacterium carnipullorum]AZA64446.1 hypothetical protein EG345_06810 [Chryseobacterium carnipullorum]STC94779.1 Uncharacterised protein [Chryseobacterium carnipullorum]